MVWRIVTNSIRRMRSAYAITALAIGLMWLSAGTLGLGTDILAASMAAAFAVGPFLGLMAAGPKEFIYLPLSRRQLWTARWITAVAIPVAVLLPTKFLGLAAATRLGLPDSLSIRSVSLSAVYDCAYAGAGLSLLLWSGGGYLRPSRVERSVRSWLRLVSVLVFVGGPIWPLIFRASLATEWSQLTGRGWVLLAAALAMTGWSFFHTPALAHPGRPQIAARGRARPISSYDATTPAKGLARLMWPDIALSVGMVTMMASFSVLVFVPASDQCTEFALIYLLLCLPSPRTMGPESVLRSLRVLPVSTWALSAILAVKPVLLYGLVWIMQEVARSGFGLRIPPLTVGMACWLVCVSSLVTAGSMKWSGHRTSRFALGLPFVLGFVFSDRLPLTFEVPFGWLSASAAGVGVAIAVLLNFHTLRHSHSVYKAVKLPGMFGALGPTT